VRVRTRVHEPRPSSKGTRSAVNVAQGAIP
jgi:hypothetical protein